MKHESQKLLSHRAHNETDVILCDSDTHMWRGSIFMVTSCGFLYFSKGKCQVLLMHLEQLSHLISVV